MDHSDLNKDDIKYLIPIISMAIIVFVIYLFIRLYLQILKILGSYYSPFFLSLLILCVYMFLSVKFIIPIFRYLFFILLVHTILIFKSSDEAEVHDFSIKNVVYIVKSLDIIFDNFLNLSDNFIRNFFKKISGIYKDSFIIFVLVKSTNTGFKNDNLVFIVNSYFKNSSKTKDKIESITFIDFTLVILCFTILVIYGIVSGLSILFIPLLCLIISFLIVILCGFTLMLFRNNIFNTPDDGSDYSELMSIVQCANLLLSDNIGSGNSSDLENEDNTNELNDEKGL